LRRRFREKMKKSSKARELYQKAEVKLINNMQNAKI
jgi:hypothetical protein